MQFEHLEGYNKVADNSMVNLMPIFLGKRFLNQSDDMPSDVEPETPNQPFDVEKFDWPWVKFKSNRFLFIVLFYAECSNFNGR